MSGAPSSARVLIIGGGIGGVCVAYHLAMLGVEDVVLLERAALSSGTTWHSTGNMETYRADPLIFEMVRYAARTYPQIAEESRRDIGWRVVGRVMYTDREERWEQLQTLPELGRARGIDIELLAPSGIAGRLPIIAPDGLLGGIWVPSDARVNPTDAVTAFAHAARARGAVIRERCAVTGIDIRGGAVRAVLTNAGEIECDLIVVAAGLWSADLLRSCGLRLPLHALEHQYLITQPFGVDRDLPLFLSFDDQLYGREEVGGLIVGSLDDQAIPVATADLPGDFASCLLSERWEQFEPYMSTAMRRFPALETAPVKMLLNGPESFTPDGQMLLGPVPGASGLYAVCGFNSNGMALAPAAGRYIAEWIVEGAPSADVSALDVRRFSNIQSDPAYLRERVTEIPGYHCRMRRPDEDYRTARDVRRSPLHDELAREGARFSQVNGWERALWLEQGMRGPRERLWLEAVAEEVRAAEDGVLLVDRSTDVKFGIRGGAARAWLEKTAPPLFAGAAADALLVPLPGAHGQVEVLARLLARTDDRCLLTASPEQDARLGEWLRLHVPAHLQAVDRTAAFACVEVRGPRRAALLEQAAAESAPQFECHEDALTDSTLVTVAAQFAVHLWRRLCELGAHSGLKPGGHFAEEALRTARGAPAFAREIGPSTLASELAGMALPPERAAAVPRTHRAFTLAAFASPLPLLGFGARDAILDQGRLVGEIVSRVRLPGWPTALALGRLQTDRAATASLETLVAGKRWPLALRTSAWQSILEEARA
jgi:glycine/D-amino acid oxidase-like deaminating enzyme/glycine cleavage system aminomethyltransferase T